MPVTKPVLTVVKSSCLIQPLLSDTHTILPLTIHLQPTAYLPPFTYFHASSSLNKILLFKVITHFQIFKNNKRNKNKHSFKVNQQLEGLFRQVKRGSVGP